ncbi:MAG: MFS transporter [Candidatus Limnocylindrales bacterium]|jgi:MFS family permease
MNVPGHVTQREAGVRPTRDRGAPTSTSTAAAVEPDQESGARAVLRNRPFLLLWLAQLSTQVGGNMVIYGLTILITTKYASATAVSALLLSFLVPAIVFSAIAGVFVDRVDKRHILLVTNVLRGLAFFAIVFVDNNLAMLYLLMIFVATVTTFFGPAEASMIPFLVPRRQLLAANGLFTLTMNAAFALGFALVGPSLVAVASPQALIVIVAILYFVAAAFCWTLPSAPPVDDTATAGQAVADAERAVETMFGQLTEGLAYIRDHRSVGWSLSYLGITGALVGILGVLGPGFAKTTLALGEKDFVVVVLPLGIGIVGGIVTLNAYGHRLPRRRTIEAGMIALGILLAVLSFAGPISHFLENNVAAQIREASRVVSVLSLVIAIAFVVGFAFAIVSISSQTQLQEELPEDVRGRVFGVLNMLVSIASLAPIIVVGPVADLVGREGVILVVGIFVALWGIASVVTRGALLPAELEARAGTPPTGAPVDAVSVAIVPAEMAGGANLVAGHAADGSQVRQ